MDESDKEMAVNRDREGCNRPEKRDRIMKIIEREEGSGNIDILGATLYTTLTNYLLVDDESAYLL